MLRKVFFALGLLLVLWSPVEASIVLDDSNGTTHIPVGPNFGFTVPPPIPGAPTIGFMATIPFEALDFYFQAPPGPGDINFCTSIFFDICTFSESSGITDVHFDRGANIGIPAGADFTLTLQGFTVGQQINAVADVPEPATFWPMGLAILAACGATVRLRMGKHLRSMLNREPLMAGRGL